MSDQNIPTDWAAYFAALGPGRPYNPPPSQMFSGEPRPWIVFMKEPKFGDLETIQVLDGESGFEVAKEAYEANEGPEMWLYYNLHSAPWHINPLPKVKKRGK